MRVLSALSGVVGISVLTCCLSLILLDGPYFIEPAVLLLLAVELAKFDPFSVSTSKL
jgi:hypothetical protein